VSAMQERDETIHEQSSASAIGGSAEAAAQSVLIVGQACATVFVTVYAEDAVEDGVAFASSAERLVKSTSLLTVVPETETRPTYVKILSKSCMQTFLP
jgi:hypothetical protein